MSYKAVVQFPCPTASTAEITAAVSRVLPQVFRLGVRYYKIGVGLIELMPTKHIQYDLFHAPTENPALMQTFDKLNQRYGSDCIFMAAQGIEHKWAMRRDKLTPQYTTKWMNLPKVQC
ncbi:DUF4113 domain-containing protein [Shewanella xiamenensis]|uniref:DUF4113 domain-containing protein n=1 Tax=Shewanella xiamenensis TaxID=332186 RepID=UPI0021C087CA|nr:DUF4113 domain-containing protein [Shewanella xiamenensis]